MLSIFILIIIAIALCASVGFGILQLIRSSDTTLLVQRNQVRVDTVVNTLRSYIRSDSGRTIVPAAVVSGTGIPSEIPARVPSIAPFTTTPWGAPLVYCPAAPSEASTPGGTVVNERDGDSETYDVELVEQGGVVYVAAGGPGTSVLRQTLRTRRVVGLVISPNPYSEGVPQCADVELASDGVTFIVPGGSVAVVYDLIGNSVPNELVFSPDGTIPAAAPSGARAVRSIADVVSYFTSYGIRDLSLTFPSGVHEVDAEEIADLASATKGKTLRIAGDGSTELRIVFGSAPAGNLSVIRFDGSVDLDGISLTGQAGNAGIDVVVAAGPGGKISLRDVSAAGVRNFGGEFALLGTTRLTPTHSADATSEPVVTSGGRVVIETSGIVINAPSAEVGVLARGGDVTVLSNTAMVLGSENSAFRAEAGGRILPAFAGLEVEITAGGATQSYPIVSAITFGTENGNDPVVSITANGVGRTLLTSPLQICEDGSANCSAECPENSVVAWGECGSDNDHPLAAFSADASGRQWTCRWAAPATVSKPTAKAVCSSLP